jgi:CheY-like chemotaxis protein
MTQPAIPQKRKLRVLIADDIQETRRSTRLMLSMISDVEVVAIASNGLQAVNMAREHHPDQHARNGRLVCLQANCAHTS